MHNDPPFVPPKSFATDGQQQYRLYCLDGTNHIQRSFEFHAQDDEAAIKIANAWREGGKAELWCQDRKICAWTRNNDR